MKFIISKIPRTTLIVLLKESSKTMINKKSVVVYEILDSNADEFNNNFLKNKRISISKKHFLKVIEATSENDQIKELFKHYK